MKFGTVVIIRIDKRCGDSKRVGFYLTSFTGCTSVRIYYDQYFSQYVVLPKIPENLLVIT